MFKSNENIPHLTFIIEKLREAMDVGMKVTIVVMPMKLKESLEADIGKLCRKQETEDIVGRRLLKKWGNVPTIYGIPIVLDPRAEFILIRGDNVKEKDKETA